MAAATPYRPLLAPRLANIFQERVPQPQRCDLGEAGRWRFCPEQVHLVSWQEPMARTLADHVGMPYAAAITFPLAFGWIMFESVPGRLDLYRIYLFGFPTTVFRVESIFGFILFHGLVWSAFLVIAGVMIAMRRRMRDAGAAALQLLREDILPLVLLFAVSLTGLLLTVSYTWLKGYGYEFLSLVHAVTVIATLLWLPFAKFFHIFQRPAQLGVSFYKDVARSEEPPGAGGVGMNSLRRCM
jgi:hypothetical protein